MPFSVAADPVLEGWWSVLHHNGAVARRSIRRGGRLMHVPAVFRSRHEADECARRLNAHLARFASTR